MIGGGGLGLVILLTLLIRVSRLKRRLAQTTTSQDDDVLRASDYKTLGNLAESQGKQHLAEGCYRNATKIEPYNKTLHYELGAFLFRVERFREAITEFSIYLKNDVILPDVYAYLAYAHFMNNNRVKAEEFYQKAQGATLSDAYGYYGLGVIAQASGKYTQARQYFEKALTLDDDFYDARQKLIDIQHHA